MASLRFLEVVRSTDIYVTRPTLFVIPVQSYKTRNTVMNIILINAGPAGSHCEHRFLGSSVGK
jgi:hypothetical protein